jgi:tyrosyl-tRNA synthetase
MASTVVVPESLTADEKFQLITRGLQEVLKPEIIRDILTKEERPLVIYWGRFSFLRFPCLPA